MRSTTYLKHLQHDPEDVSAFLVDLCNDSKWRREITHVDLVSGLRGDVGSEYSESVTWEGIQAEATLSVTEFVQGSRLVVVARDPGYESRYEYDFVQVDGGTDLKLLASIETKGPLRLIEPFMWALVSRWVEQSLDELDSVLGRPELFEDAQAARDEAGH